MARHFATVAVMIPQLPAEQIREAIQAEDWPRAIELLAEHENALAQALARVDRSTVDREPWRELLLAQRALLDELHSARNKTMAALEHLAQDRRSARAWLRELL